MITLKAGTAIQQTKTKTDNIWQLSGILSIRNDVATLTTLKKGTLRRILQSIEMMYCM